MEPSLLQAKQAHFPQPFFIGEGLQPSDHLSGPPLDPLQEVDLLLDSALTSTKTKQNKTKQNKQKKTTQLVVSLKFCYGEDLPQHGLEKPSITKDCFPYSLFFYFLFCLPAGVIAPACRP